MNKWHYKPLVFLMRCGLEISIHSMLYAFRFTIIMHNTYLGLMFYMVIHKKVAEYCTMNRCHHNTSDCNKTTPSLNQELPWSVSTAINQKSVLSYFQNKFHIQINGLEVKNLIYGHGYFFLTVHKSSSSSSW